MSGFVAIDSNQWMSDHLISVIGVAIVVLGLGIFGLKDLFRFSVKRIWAISGVCFDESIRRKVLWIIPLAIVGLVLVVMFQQPFDEQDAIRETTKFCLFATGMVVVISTIILACTNLPREIENRVIFTVVTKPTTRLEIVLGKITGFARVSATILAIMGLFSFGYLHFRAWSLESDLRDRLKTNAIEAISRPTFQHYVDAGLLNAKTLANPDGMNIYAAQPVLGSKRRYPAVEGMMLFPFRLPPDMLALNDPDGKQTGGAGMLIQVRVGFDPTLPTAAPGKPMPPSQPPKVAVQIMDENINSVSGGEIKDNPAVIPTVDGSQFVNFIVPSNYAALLAKYPLLYIAVSFGGGDGKMWVEDENSNPAVQLQVPVASQTAPLMVYPSNPSNPSLLGHPVFIGREGVSGQQVKGDPAGKSQVCIFRYRGLKLQQGSSDFVPIEFRSGVEKSGEVGDQDVPTLASMTVLNLSDGKISDPIPIQPENNRPFYAKVPASAVAGGNFDLIVRCLSPEQWLNLKRSSVSIVQAENSFGLNLLKSLLILWLLSILVTSISIFCSTFLSWPIAVVLTLVILLGRWGVNQLGDAATAGVGRQFVQDFGVKDPATMQVLSGTVEQLNKSLKMVATVLPDIEQFAATDDIDRGISIPARTIADSGWVLLGFGLPLTVLAYVFLKNKEVAP